MTQQHKATLGIPLAEAVTALAPAELSGNVDLYLQARREGRFWRYQGHLNILLAALINRAINNEVVFMGIRFDEFELTKIPIHFLIANFVQIVGMTDGQLENATIGPYHANFYGVRVFIAADLAPLPAPKAQATASKKTGPPSIKTDAIVRAMMENLSKGHITANELRLEKLETLRLIYKQSGGAKSLGTYKIARDRALSLFVKDRNTEK